MSVELITVGARKKELEYNGIMTVDQVLAAGGISTVPKDATVTLNGRKVEGGAFVKDKEQVAIIPNISNG